MRKSVLFVCLSAFASAVQAQWYVGGAIGQGFATAKNFRFHNPDGAPFAAAPGPGPHIPMNSVDNKDDSAQWSVRGGYQFTGTPWRLELDYTNRGRVAMRGFADFGPGANFQQDLRIRSSSVLAMAYYDHALNRDWAVYGGLGLGWARNRADGSQGANLGGTGFFPGASNSNTAWAAALGVSRKLTDRLTGDIGYRYVDLGRANTGTTDASFGALVPFAMNPNERLESKLYMHELRAGLNYRF